MINTKELEIIGKALLRNNSTPTELRNKCIGSSGKFHWDEGEGIMGRSIIVIVIQGKKTYFMTSDVGQLYENI